MNCMKWTRLSLNELDEMNYVTVWHYYNITLRFFCIWVRVDLGYELTWVRVDRGYELTWYELTLGTSWLYTSDSIVIALRLLIFMCPLTYITNDIAILSKIQPDHKNVNYKFQVQS